MDSKMAKSLARLIASEAVRNFRDRGDWPPKRLSMFVPDIDKHPLLHHLSNCHGSEAFWAVNNPAFSLFVLLAAQAYAEDDCRKLQLGEVCIDDRGSLCLEIVIAR